MGGRSRLRQVVFGLLIALIGVGACTTPAPTPTPTVPPRPTVIVTRAPTPTPADVGSADHDLGPESAYLRITHYGDFAAPATTAIARNLLILANRYPSEVRLTWRHLPDPANPLSLLAAAASEAAADQGVFWPFHDLILAEQESWRGLSQAEFAARLPDFAARAGVNDVARFAQAVNEGRYNTLVSAAAGEAKREGVQAAPALTFNRRPFTGRIDLYDLDSVVRLILLEKRHFKAQPPLQIDLNARYVATLYTDYGEVEIELFTRAAPVAVNNFVFLARQGWYDGITFHLVTPELAQTGDPSGTGLGTAGYFIADESDNGLIFDREGMVAMASKRGVMNSASSQFFITFGPLPPEGFNGQFTIFGQVTRGMDALRRLRPRDDSDRLRDPNPPPGDRLIQVKITEIK